MYPGATYLTSCVAGIYPDSRFISPSIDTSTWSGGCLDCNLTTRRQIHDVIQAPNVMQALCKMLVSPAVGPAYQQSTYISRQVPVPSSRL